MSLFKELETSVSIFAGDFCAERMKELSDSGIRFIEFTGSHYSSFNDFLADPKKIFDTNRCQDHRGCSERVVEPSPCFCVLWLLSVYNS